MVYGFRVETELDTGNGGIFSTERNVYPMDKETAERRLAEVVNEIKTYCPCRVITRAEVVVETRFEEV